MRLGLRATAALLLWGVLLPAHAEAPFVFEKTPGELPKSIIPLDYAVHIAPDLQRFTFEGLVTARFRVLKRSSALVLNARNLEIRSAVLISGTARRSLKPVLDPRRELLTFALAPALAPGEYDLEIAYAGIINAQSQGLYHGRYVTEQGTSVMLSTQMEPADARTMLPCWDEPVFRASFRLSVDLPERMTAYSNMPVDRTDALPDGRRRTHFRRTPKMASYLLVLVAGELESLQGEQDGVKLGIVSAKGTRASGEYALKITKNLLRYYNDYFGTPYPLPKLDQFAVPSTAGFGAMENWGGITYDERLLLFDPERSGDARLRSIHNVVAHEVAHQWFGDLVTMAWWDNLWLNEGFAEWMDAKATDYFNPDWGVWEATASGREAAMALDARKTTHPIQQPVRDAREANDAFDLITYQKGQAFLRMLEAWLGEGNFRDGLRRYMARHAYSNTTTADLWQALEDASGKPVRRMAQAWTEEPGFPLVTVDASCKDGMRHIRLSQQQFTADAKPGRRHWHIPVALASGVAASDVVTAGDTATARSAPTYELLDSATREVTRPGCEGAVVADPQAVGYFRVEYAAPLREALMAHWGELASTTRLKLLTDGWALAGVGRLPVPAYLDMVAHARADAEPVIWHTLVAHLEKFDSLARGEGARPALRAFAVKTLKPRLDQLGWEPRDRDGQQVRELRTQLIGALGYFGEPAVVAEAKARFTKFVERPDSLPPALADPVIRIAGQYADAATHAELLRQLRKAQGSEQQRRFVGALASVADRALAQKTLELTLDDSLPRPLTSNIPAMVAAEHPDLAWTFAKQHYAALRQRVVSFDQNSYFSGILSQAADARLADEMEAWGARNLPKEAATMTRRNADGIRFNARLKARLLPPLQKELAAQQ